MHGPAFIPLGGAALAFCPCLLRQGAHPEGTGPFLGLSGLRALGLVWRAASRMRPSLAPCMMVGPSWAAILKGAGRGR